MGAPVATLSIANEKFTIEVSVGTTIQQICNDHPTSIQFGCREALCGACMIRVLEGGEHLSRLEARERALLQILDAESDRRLACQCAVFGDVVIEVVD